MLILVPKHELVKFNEFTPSNTTTKALALIARYPSYKSIQSPYIYIYQIISQCLYSILNNFRLHKNNFFSEQQTKLIHLLILVQFYPPNSFVIKINKLYLGETD